MIPTLQIGGLGRFGPQAASVAGFLDELATLPRAALSVKKLVSTATNALRVRRSSDSTEQDIGFTGTALDTASLATFVGANSAYTKTLYDQAGNSEELIQATATNQPRIVNAGTYDGRVIFDGSNDGMSITSLTQGAAQAAMYWKGRFPSGIGVKIIAELSTNYNSNPQSFVVYYDTTLSANHMWISSLNGSGSLRLQYYTVAAGSDVQISILIDRTLAGSDEIKVWNNGTALTPTVHGTSYDQTGVFTSYDTFIGSRANASLYSDIAVESLVFYNADTSAIRASIESIIG